MAQPNSKATLKEYCLRRLGKPVLEINVSDDQVDDAIDYTLQKFQQYHYDGAERCYLKHKVTQDVIDRSESNTTSTSKAGNDSWTEGNGYIEIPDHILSVEGIFSFTDKGTSNMFDIRYQMRLNDLYDFTSTQFYHYYMIQQHLSTIDFLLEGIKPVRYHAVQDRLYLDFDWGSAAKDDFLIIDCYRLVDPNSYSRVWNDSFLKRYVTALVKRQWGQNLMKFQGVKLPGGIELNGRQIYDDAQTDLEVIREQMSNTYELPPYDMIG